MIVKDNQKMDLEYKTIWISALMSKSYRQGKGYLRALRRSGGLFKREGTPMSNEDPS